MNVLLRYDPPPRTPIVNGEIKDPYARTTAFEDADSQDLLNEQLLRISLMYYATTMLQGPPKAPYHGKFLIGRHHIAWDEAVRAHNRILTRASRDHGKSFTWCVAYPIWKADKNHPGSLGYVFSASQTLAEERLKETKDQLEENPKLEHLVPIGKDRTWSRREIRTTTGTLVRARGWGTRIRGGHPHWIVCDDCLDEHSLYSETVRNRSTDFFFGAISNMVANDGQIIVPGCVVPNTYITTTEGLKRIISCSPEHVERQKFEPINIEIETKDGKGVATRFWFNGNSDTIKIVTNRGYELEGTSDHGIWIIGTDGIARWKQLSDITTDDYVAIRIGANCWGNKIGLDDFDSRKPAFQEKRKARNKIKHDGYIGKDLAYLLGLWVAEGSAESQGRVSISNTEKEIREWLLSGPCGMEFRYTSSTSPGTARCSCTEFLDLIRWLGGKIGRAHEKEIPEKIMCADRETVIEFLRGLFDGDGSSYKAQTCMQIALATTSEKLSMQVHQLLLNFGILATRKRGPTRRSERVQNPKHDVYVVRITGKDADNYLSCIGFRLARKQKTERGSFQKIDRGIPRQSKFVKLARKEKRRRRKGTGGQPFNITAALDADMASLFNINQAIAWFDDSQANGPAIRQLKENIIGADRFVWQKVKDITCGNSETYDFYVPGSHSFVSNGIVSHNTPLHWSDLYGKIEETKKYFVADFPALDENEEPLFPERYSKQDLEEKKQEIGPIRFAREFLVRPLSDEASLFPTKLFEGSDVRLPYVLGLPASYWEEKEMLRYGGVDIALSAEIGSDYFVIITVAVDAFGNRWLVDIFRERGLSFQAQKDAIKESYVKYRHEILHIEANQMQRVWPQEIARETDIPIRSFFTTGRQPKQDWKRGMTSISVSKHHLDRGVPSLRISFENRKWRIPRGDVNSIDKTDQWIGEFGCLSIQDGKVVSVGEHDDLPMATWMTDTAIRMAGYSHFHFAGTEQDGITRKSLMSSPKKSDLGIVPTTKEIAEQVDENNEEMFDPFGLKSYGSDNPLLSYPGILKPGQEE